MPHLPSLAVLAAIVLCAAPARAQDPPKPEGPAAPRPATATAAAGPGVVRIEIDETVEGRPSRENLAAFFIRKKLREAGYKAWSVRPIRADEFQKPKPGEPDPNAEKPAPDLIVKGKVTLDASRVSTFYGKNLAFSYEGSGELQVLDPSGKVLDRIGDRDEWGQETQEQARDETLKRISVFLASDVLKAPSIHSRLSEKAKAAVDAYLADVEKKRHKKEDGN